MYTVTRVTAGSVTIVCGGSRKTVRKDTGKAGRSGGVVGPWSDSLVEEYRVRIDRDARYGKASKVWNNLSLEEREALLERLQPTTCSSR